MDTKPPTNIKSAHTPPVPSRFWANWNSTIYAPYILRRDTRIYWEPQCSGTNGQCVGSFFGENPGSGEPSFGWGWDGYSPIQDGQYGDPTLRLIHEIWKYSKSASSRKPNPTDFIEVLNLYYFRNSDSGKAIEAWRSLSGAVFYNPDVSASSKFVILGWGTLMNTSPEAKAAIANIPSYPKVIVPNITAKVLTVSTPAHPLSSPLFPYPPSPSGILRCGQGPNYKAAVAAMI